MIQRLLAVLALTLCITLAASAQDAIKKEKKVGKVLVVITHEVKDYAAWRKGYDADGPNRKKGGFKVQGVYADVNNPNMITIVGEFPSAAAAEAFAGSPQLKEAMDKAGVIGKPDVKVLTRQNK
jgi:hypothetical protein